MKRKKLKIIKIKHAKSYNKFIIVKMPKFSLLKSA